MTRRMERRVGIYIATAIYAIARAMDVRPLIAQEE